MITTDVILESFRVIVLIILVSYLWRLGQKKNFIKNSGWNYIQGGFTLVLFGSILDITDNFDSLNAYIFIGDTKTEAFLEKVVGYLGGFSLLTIGLIQWGPTVEQLMEQVSRHKASEKALKNSELRFRDFTESATDWFWEQDMNFRFTEAIAFKESKFGARSQNAIGRTRWEMAEVNLDEDTHWQKHANDLLAHRSFRDFRYTVNDTEGNPHIFSISGKPIYDETGEFTGYRGTGTDATELAKAQSTNERFLFALDHLSEGLALWDAEGQFVLCNALIHKFAEAANVDLYPGVTFREWLQAHLDNNMIPEAVGREETWLSERMDYFENPVGSFEVQRAGRWYLFRLQKLPGGGTMQSIFDIHDMKQNEDMLRQSQRMEVIGQLTGGVAHDFNNLLGIMIGNTEILGDKVSNDDTALPHIEALLKAVERASSLTNRLLSFSRLQPLLPGPTDISRLFCGIEEMLQRTLGETITIIIKALPNLSAVMVDPHQLDNALLNLTINARDAMPNGGLLTIEADNTTLNEAYTDQHAEVAPGNYVKITISDTGIGITPAHQKKVFEPFFTTKEFGKGSGLGLSMVYGFVKQSNGHIVISSNTGNGTTVSLYLPATTEIPIVQEAKALAADIVLGQKTTLLVEDDPEVRKTTASILNHLGYKVIEAQDGLTALDILEQKSNEIDLVFSDIVMPNNLSGIELAEKILTTYKGTKILLTSGYPDKIAEHEAISKLGIKLLVKPYMREQLIAAIEGEISA